LLWHVLIVSILDSRYTLYFAAPLYFADHGQSVGKANSIQIIDLVKVSMRDRVAGQRVIRILASP
jgi:hypothetical protein